MRKISLFLLILFIPFYINAKEVKLNNIVPRNENAGSVMEVLKSKDGNYVITSLNRNTHADGGIAVLEKRDPNGKLIWEVVYGTSTTTSMIKFSSMAITKDDSIVIAGYFNETDDIGLENNGLYDGLLIKFDKDGNLLWQKNWGGSSHDFFNEMVLDQQDNIYVTGIYNSTDIDTIENKGQRDSVVLKYDQSGNQLWAKSVSGSKEDCIQYLSIDNKNNLLLTAYSKSPEVNGLTLNGDKNLLTLKYDTNGNIVWFKKIMLDKNSFSYKSHMTSDFGYLQAASATTTEFDDITLNAQKDIVIVKYDTNGNILWKKIGAVVKVKRY